MNIFKETYRYLGKCYRRVKFLTKINWIKTIYFNFKMFPFPTAKKMPVYFYGKVKLSNISGTIIIEAPIKSGMIGFGQPYEIITQSKRTAELFLEGTFVCRGHIQFGKDFFVYVAKSAVLEMGHMSSLGNSGKIICYYKITLGDYCRIGFESQLIDSTIHQMIDTVSKDKFPMVSAIVLGSFNYFGNRITIMKDTVTPMYCSIASSSLCNKDYTPLGKNILIGGVPAKLLKNNICRDWEEEIPHLNQWLIV
ncbi:acyltransferase [Flavobacterium sp. XGLA_31]|uniref:acyltransferase n=1 Tax=Flavobacterium sp. XGLA_31 TaxID=3447666 RepID=UPI003F3ED018